MEGWRQVIGRTAPQPLWWRLTSLALLLAMLSAVAVPVRAEVFPHGDAGGVVRIGITSSDGARRTVFVRVGSPGEHQSDQAAASQNTREERAIARPRVDAPRIFAPRREQPPELPAVPTADRRSLSRVGNVEWSQARWAQNAPATFVQPAPATGGRCVRLGMAPAAEPQRGCSRAAPDDSRATVDDVGWADRRAAPSAGERIAPVSESGGFDFSAQTTGLHTAMIVVGIVLCVLLLLLVVVLLLRPQSGMAQPAIRVEIGHTPVAAKAASQAEITAPRAEATTARTASVPQRGQAADGSASLRPSSNDVPGGRIPAQRRGAVRKEEPGAEADEAASGEAGIMERIVEDNVALCEELAGFAA